MVQSHSLIGLEGSLQRHGLEPSGPTQLGATAKAVGVAAALGAGRGMQLCSRTPAAARLPLRTG